MADAICARWIGSYGTPYRMLVNCNARAFEFAKGAINNTHAKNKPLHAKNNTSRNPPGRRSRISRASRAPQHLRTAHTIGPPTSETRRPPRSRHLDTLAISTTQIGRPSSPCCVGSGAPHHAIVIVSVMRHTQTHLRHMMEPRTAKKTPRPVSAQLASFSALPIAPAFSPMAMSAGKM